MERKMGEHSAVRIALMLLMVVVFIAMLAFNGLAAANAGGVFKNKTGDIADKFNLEVVPAGWTFSIWGVIYAWQAIWIIYVLTTICRQKVGTYMYLLPVYPPVVYISFIANNAFNIAWLFAWDRQKLAIGLPLIALTPFTLYVCLFFSFKRLYDNLDYMIKKGLSVDVWLIRFLIQNGLAFYAAWVTVATLLNLGYVLTYKDGSDVTDLGLAQDESSTIVLSILSFEIVLWFGLDIFVLDKYTRYLFSPYVTLTVALAGVVQKNYNLDTAYRNSIFSLVLLIAAGTCLLLKLIIMVVRHCKRPIESRVSYEPTV